MVKAIFFDLDGTLLDTVPDIMGCLNFVLARYGYPLLTESDTRAFVGNGARRLVELSVPPWAPAEEILAEFRTRYAVCANAHTRIYEGAGECLANLKARGVKLAVITNKPHEATQRVVSQFFPDLFDFVGGDSGSFPVKPDPALVRYAALTLRVSSAECLFVGDGETDVQTARNAKMRCVAALWGYRSRAQLEAAGAKLFASSFCELENITEKFL